MMPRRLFVAIDLPKEVCWRLAQLLAAPPRGVRAVRPAQLHLTLHFLGDVADAARAALPEALARVSAGRFELGIRGTGVFPPRGRPSVLWAAVAESAPLTALHAAILAALDSCGVEVERRPYVPHVTLARLTPAVPRAWTSRFLADTVGLRSEAIPADRFILSDSRKRDGATEHAVAATFSLGPHGRAVEA
jgi:RNA 2',3'-cyclic 3'-phosphodiesterase